jgi:hypothetical protein
MATLQQITALRAIQRVYAGTSTVRRTAYQAFNSVSNGSLVQITKTARSSFLVQESNPCSLLLSNAARGAQSISSHPMLAELSLVNIVSVAGEDHLSSSSLQAASSFAVVNKQLSVRQHELMDSSRRSSHGETTNRLPSGLAILLGLGTLVNQV